jgi:hypothetical protein
LPLFKDANTLMKWIRLSTRNYPWVKKKKGFGDTKHVPCGLVWATSVVVCLFQATSFTEIWGCSKVKVLIGFLHYEAMKCCSWVLNIRRTWR